MKAKANGNTVDIIGNSHYEDNAGAVATVYPQKVVEWNEIRYKPKIQLFLFWEMMLPRKKVYLINSKELFYLTRNWQLILKNK